MLGAIELAYVLYDEMSGDEEIEIWTRAPGGVVLRVGSPNRALKFKRKRRSCAMCKPHKTGGASRFKRREQLVREDERTMRDLDLEAMA